MPKQTSRPPATPPPPPADPEVNPVFDFTDDRKFALYMHQRENHAKGAREAYQRFDQTIVGLSAGSIVLSITFLKDIGHAPDSLGWLLASWLFFLLASLSAFFSLLTSAEADREQIKQLDCQVENGTCDTTRSERLGRNTVKLNTAALICCILGVLLIMIFAIINVLRYGGTEWPNGANSSETNPPANSSQSVTTGKSRTQSEATPFATTKAVDSPITTATAATTSSRLKQQVPRKAAGLPAPTPVTQSRHP